MSSAPDYGFGAKLLHHLALSADFIADAAFDIEQSRFLSQCTAHSDAHHVFIAGLARAGTTLLMRFLYESGGFCSLTYRDMPFVMAPNIWARVSSGSKRQKTAAERAHGDGVYVDYDSPEALEEVFWRVNASRAYLNNNELIPMEADGELIDRFRDYVNLIQLRYSATRYLSKNNNNILRIGSLSRAFPKATVLVPYRDPVQHSASLMNQHSRFSKEQKSDSFIKKYMTWLGHHEFGLDHRPFRFGSYESDEKNPDNINYWLGIWIDTHSPFD